MREYPPVYAIRIEMPQGTLGSVTHTGPLAPLIACLLAKHGDLKARVEAADARCLRLSKKPRGLDPLPDADEFGGL